MIRPLNEDDLEQLYAIRQVAFLDTTDYSRPEAQQVHKDRLKYRYGSFEGDQLAASASWYPFNMYLHGPPQSVWGLASVSTGGEFRRRGHVGRLLDAGLQMMNRQSVAWCLEYPFDPRFYNRWGWETIRNGTFVEVPPERLRGPKMDAQRVTLADQAGLDQMEVIYDRWASRYNFAFCRDEVIQKSWQYLFGRTPWGDFSAKRFAYVMEGAFCMASIDRVQGKQTLRILDFAHSTPDGFHALLGLWAGFAGQVDLVRMQLPADAPLLPEFSEFVVPHPHPLQARIVSAKDALSNIPCDQFLSLVLRISDDTCPWNNTSFRLRGTGEHTVAEPTQDEADVDIDIRALARLLAGSMDIDTAIHYGEATALTDRAMELERLAIRPSHMSLADYF